MHLNDQEYANLLTASLETVLASSHEAMALCDEALGFIQVNQPFAQLLGCSAESLHGQSLTDWLRLHADGPAFQTAIAAGRDWQGQCLLHAAAQAPPMQLQLRSIGAGMDWPKRWLLWLYPPNASGDAERGIVQDALTGLPSRMLFLDRIDQALIAAARVKKSVALLLIGIDRFILINDGLGRQAGDQVLQECARRLAATVRRSDTLARFEGDRFGTVMQIASTKDSVLVAEKILTALQQPLRIGEQDLGLSVSIGISIFPDDGASREELLAHAESAMRHQKKQGGNHYQFFAAEMNQAAKSRLDMERDIRQALANEEFVVHYQPKVALGNNAIVGAEALVRWQKPGVGLISPGQFIPVAEETGLVAGIGNYVLQQACHQASGWLRQGLSPVRISVNVTASQFNDAQLLARVEQALTESGLPARYLELEITESMLIGDLDQVIAKLNAIRAMDIHISIDDFGTGYSSLSYLSRFPITTLKIDRAFVHDMVNNPRTAEITNAIIGLSRGLDLEVVAEGAESREHIQLLRAQSCDLVQGFYYSRPLPPAEFEQLLRNGYLYDN